MDMVTTAKPFTPLRFGASRCLSTATEWTGSRPRTASSTVTAGRALGQPIRSIVYTQQPAAGSSVYGGGCERREARRGPQVE